MEFRIEKDTLGEVKVLKNALWGPQTQRSMPIEIIHAFAILKKAAAYTNFELGVLSEKKMKLISLVCDEIIDEKHNDQFPLVIWQTVS